MIKTLLLFIILIAGILIGPVLVGHQGYVLIQTHHYHIETSVTSLLMIFVITLFVILFVSWLARTLIGRLAKTFNWFKMRKYKKVQQRNEAGLMKLAEGDYPKAEKLLGYHAEYAHTPLANYLLAAEAAQQQENVIASNQYLEKAAEHTDENPLAFKITCARLQLARNEFKPLQHNLQELLNEAPRHPAVLKLAEQFYHATKNPAALIDILPTMRKTHLYSEAKLHSLETHAYQHLAQQTFESSGSDTLLQWWHDLPRKVTHQPAIRATVITQLIQSGDTDNAQLLLQKGLRRDADPTLLKLIPLVMTPDSKELIRLFDKQRDKNKFDPLLERVQAHILMRQGKWQDAYSTYQNVFRQDPMPDDYISIANILDKLHRTGEANQFRQEGLLLYSKLVPSTVKQ